MMTKEEKLSSYMNSDPVSLIKTTRFLWQCGVPIIHAHSRMLQWLKKFTSYCCDPHFLPSLALCKDFPYERRACSQSDQPRIYTVRMILMRSAPDDIVSNNDGMSYLRFKFNVVCSCYNNKYDYKRYQDGVSVVTTSRFDKR